MSKRVLEVLYGSSEGRAAICCIGAGRIARMAEYPKGWEIALQEMQHADKIGMRYLGDLWQRVMGSLLEVR